MFCEKICDSMNGRNFIRPFIANDPSVLFSKISPEFEEQRKLLQDFDDSTNNVAIKLEVKTEIQNNTQTTDETKLSDIAPVIDKFVTNASD
jgi:hypothetical protein